MSMDNNYYFFLLIRCRAALANGTSRLQLDIVKSAEIPFHTLFSSQLLSLTKVRNYENESVQDD